MPTEDLREEQYYQSSMRSSPNFTSSEKRDDLDFKIERLVKYATEVSNTYTQHRMQANADLIDKLILAIQTLQRANLVNIFSWKNKMKAIYFILRYSKFVCVKGEISVS